MVEVRSPLTAITTRRIFEISRSCRMAPLHIVRCGALRNDARGHRSDSIPIQTNWFDRAGCDAARSLRRTHLPRSTPTQRVRSRTLCRPFIAVTNAKNHESTFNMGRRIMTERGHRQRKRTRRIAPDSRRDLTAAVDGRTDEALRTLVRVLARQAAREVFESECRRTTPAVH